MFSLSKLGTVAQHSRTDAKINMMGNFFLHQTANWIIIPFALMHQIITNNVKGNLMIVIATVPSNSDCY